MSRLSLADLRRANLARLPLFRDAHGRLSHPPIEGQPHGFDWSLSDWLTATAGELGEAANLIKKVNRGDLTLDEARPALAKELADVLTYLDILAHRAGVDLDAATIAKWNEISARVGAPLRLTDAGELLMRRFGETVKSGSIQPEGLSWDGDAQAVRFPLSEALYTALTGPQEDTNAQNVVPVVAVGPDFADLVVGLPLSEQGLSDLLAALGFEDGTPGEFILRFGWMSPAALAALPEHGGW